MVVDDYKHQTYDAINTAIARQALRTLNETSNGKFHIPEDIIMSATQKRPICRFEEFDLTNDRNEKIHVILDVCHNQPGFEAMYATMQKVYPNVNLRVIVGS